MKPLNPSDHSFKLAWQVDLPSQLAVLEETKPTESFHASA